MSIAIFIIIAFALAVIALSWKRIHAAARRPANGEAKDLVRAEGHVQTMLGLISTVRREAVRQAVAK